MGVVEAVLLGLSALAMIVARVARPRADFARDRWERVLEEVPRSPISAARAGRVRIEGTAERLSEVLLSPIHRVECLAYKVEIGNYERKGGQNAQYVKIRDESRAVPFLVRDDSGPALVEPDQRVDVELAYEAVPMMSLSKAAKSYVGEYLHESGLAAGGAILGTSYTVREHRLDPGEPCTVVGEVARFESLSAGAVYRAAESVPVLADRKIGLLVTDRHGADLEQHFSRAARAWTALFWVGAVVALLVLAKVAGTCLAG